MELNPKSSAKKLGASLVTRVEKVKRKRTQARKSFLEGNRKGKKRKNTKSSNKENCSK